MLRTIITCLSSKWRTNMFSSSFEIDNKNIIMINTEIEQLSNSLNTMKSLVNNIVKLVISLKNESELAELYSSDLNMLESQHVSLRMSMSVFHNLDFDYINNNYLLKNIVVTNGEVILNLFLMNNIPIKVIENNKKIFTRFLNETHVDWKPVYNVLNESLVLSKNLTDELNSAILNKKKNHEYIKKIKSILNKV